MSENGNICSNYDGETRHLVALAHSLAVGGGEGGSCYFRDHSLSFVPPPLLLRHRRVQVRSNEERPHDGLTLRKEGYDSADDGDGEDGQDGQDGGGDGDGGDDQCEKKSYKRS